MTLQRVPAPLADVADGSRLAVEVDGVEVAVVQTRRRVSSPIGDECSHADDPAAEGDVDGCEIECWLHGSRFDLRTGEPTSLPAYEPVPVYPVSSTATTSSSTSRSP